MRTTHLLHLAAACSFSLLTSLPTCAQEPAKFAPPPPKLQVLDESEQPAVTIRQPQSSTQITEKRDHGDVKEIKVKSGGSTYYLKPKQGTGNVASDDVSVPQWKVHEFGPGGNGDADKVPATPVAPAVPTK